MTTNELTDAASIVQEESGKLQIGAIRLMIVNVPRCIKLMEQVTSGKKLSPINKKELSAKLGQHMGLIAATGLIRAHKMLDQVEMFNAFMVSFEDVYTGYVNALEEHKQYKKKE